MATVYGIVTQHGGLIDIQSAPGSGTTVKVYLPLASATGEESTAIATDSGFLEGSEEVWIVEDEDAVRFLAEEILVEHGYQVRSYAAPDEALAVFSSLRKKDRPDLILADVIMPGLSGVQLASELRKKSRGLKVLLMSGYTDDALEERGLSDADHELLMKPFTIEGLCRRVRNVLDGNI
jgi:CheY-like chemotaxis protein